MLATSGPEGRDCSPRGDKPGFVSILDERTLLLPDRRGKWEVETDLTTVAQWNPAVSVERCPQPEPTVRRMAPVSALLAIYAKENGQGMMFPADGVPQPPVPDPEKPAPQRKGPQLRVVK